MKKITLLALLPIMLVALAGCGQKGDLYVPGEEEPPSRHLLDDPEDSADDQDRDEHSEADSDAAQDKSGD